MAALPYSVSGCLMPYDVVQIVLQPVHQRVHFLRRRLAQRRERVFNVRRHGLERLAHQHAVLFQLLQKFA